MDIETHIKEINLIKKIILSNKVSSSTSVQGNSRNMEQERAIKIIEQATKN